VKEMAKAKIPKCPECKWGQEKSRKTCPLASWEGQGEITNDVEKTTKEKGWQESPCNGWICATVVVSAVSTHLLTVVQNRKLHSYSVEAVSGKYHCTTPLSKPPGPSPDTVVLRNYE
jgi:hypothetical protein